jgi:GABA(A) receptor-associated protein
MTTALRGIFGGGNGSGPTWPAFPEEARRRIAEKYPDRIPVMLVRHPSARDLPDLPKPRFLVPMDLTLGQFIFIVRRHLTMAPEKALFLFVGNTLQPSSRSMNELYFQFRAEDGALRMCYTSEATFG